MAGLIINPRARIFHGHDWVYASDIKKAFGKPEPGDVVTLKDFKDRPLGCAIYNPASQIVARRISRRIQKLDRDFFTRRIQRAVESRKGLGLSPDIPQRIIWSESDGLPGVVVDRYGSHLVIQTLTLAMDKNKTELVAALVDVFAPSSVIERNDSPVRKAEGLEPVTGILHGSDPGTIEISDGTVTYSTSFLEGQKTGLYLDQFDNYRAVAAHAAGRNVLDLFTNQGGFALHAAKAGAASVTAIDISETATAATAKNAKLNDLTNVDVKQGNVFDHLKYLTGLEDAQRPAYDLIILDPPLFHPRQEKPPRRHPRLQRNPPPLPPTTQTWRPSRYLLLLPPRHPHRLPRRRVRRFRRRQKITPRNLQLPPTPRPPRRPDHPRNRVSQRLPLPSDCRLLARQHQDPPPCLSPNRSPSSAAPMR